MFKAGLKSIQVTLVNHGQGKGGKASNETLALRNATPGVFWPPKDKNRTTFYRTTNSKFYSTRLNGIDVHMRTITLISFDKDYVDGLHASNKVKLLESVLDDNNEPLRYTNGDVVDYAVKCIVDARFIDANGNLVFESEPSPSIDEEKEGTPIKDDESEDEATMARLDAMEADGSYIKDHSDAKDDDDEPYVCETCGSDICACLDEDSEE